MIIEIACRVKASAKKTKDSDGILCIKHRLREGGKISIPVTESLPNLELCVWKTVHIDTRSSGEEFRLRSLDATNVSKHFLIGYN